MKSEDYMWQLLQISQTIIKAMIKWRINNSTNVSVHQKVQFFCLKTKYQNNQRRTFYVINNGNPWNPEAIYRVPVSVSIDEHSIKRERPRGIRQRQ